MSKQPTRQQRRRTNKPSYMPFYLGLGLVGILVLMFILISTLNSSPTTNTASTNAESFIPRATTAQVGQTADGYWYKGDPNAPIKVDVFSDYQCPYCFKLEADLAANGFDQQYVENGKVQVIYHEFPLSNIHQWAQLTAETARCAGDQGLFWPVHDAIFASQNTWSKSADARGLIVSTAVQAGANRDKLNQCLNASTHKTAIQAAYDTATQRKLQGTPTVFVNGKEVVFADRGYTQSLVKAIEAANGSVK